MNLKIFDPQFQIVLALGNAQNPVPYLMLKKYFVDEVKNFEEIDLKVSLDRLEESGSIYQKPFDIKKPKENYITQGYVLDERVKEESELDFFLKRLPSDFPCFKIV